MGVPLRVLLVEDDEDEASLVLRALSQAGYDLQPERVENATDLVAALARQRWEVILCDYAMPQLSALAALRIIRDRAPEVPVIIVSGQIGEQFAVEAMRAGAHDYVSKHNLARLVPAIERELKESQARLARQRAEDEKVTLLEVARDVAGTVDLGEILDRVHRRTVEVLPCDGIATWYWNPARGVYGLARQSGIPERFRRAVEALSFTPEHPTIEGLSRGQVLVLNDMAAQDRLPREWATRFEFASLVAVPLIVRSWMPGMLVAVRELGSGAFDEREVQLLEGIARQLALGVNAVELYRSQEQEARVSAALARAGRELISALSEDDLVTRLCRVTADALNCDASHTMLLDPLQQSWSLLGGHGDSLEARESMRLIKMPSAIMTGLVERLEREEVVQVQFTEPTDMLPWELGLHYGFTGGMFAALRRGEQVFGLQTAEYRGTRDKFSPHDERILSGVARLVALALDHVYLVGELERANRLKSDFVATMSHELRTPLNVIMGYSDLLIDGEFGALSAEQTDVLRRIDRSAGELLELINATLDVSRLDAGTLAVTGQELRLQELLEEIDAETREIQNLKPDVAFVWNVSTQLQALHTDRTKLKVVIKNLVTNAAKFTDRGSVTVSADAGDGGAVVTVMDTGIGIAPQAHAIIFEPFRQVDSSITRRHGGVGLGLYIAHRLVELLGGHIEVESEVGKGSMFRVWLPSAGSPSRGTRLRG